MASTQTVTSTKNLHLDLERREKEGSFPVGSSFYYMCSAQSALSSACVSR